MHLPLLPLLLARNKRSGRVGGVWGFDYLDVHICACPPLRGTGCRGFPKFAEDGWNSGNSFLYLKSSRDFFFFGGRGGNLSGR